MQALSDCWGAATHGHPTKNDVIRMPLQMGCLVMVISKQLVCAATCSMYRPCAGNSAVGGGGGALWMYEVWW
jgi:hypothetical protein